MGDTHSPLRPTDWLSRDEIAALTRRSDARGGWAIVSVWASIAALFALCAMLPHPVTWLLAVVAMGNRQLALAILEHEAAHRTLFRTRWLNDHAADWLCARPIWQHVGRYRAHHNRHHKRAGQPGDPDESLYRSYPTTRARFARKLLRDISGYTMVKVMFGLILMDAGVIRWTVANDIERLPRNERRWWSYPITLIRNSSGMLVTNAVLAGVLIQLGHGALYGIWLAGYLFAFPLFVRIRALAEHAMLPAGADIRSNTRTTQAGWLARCTVAPMHVNYHLEHHFMASVPYYRLPALHRLLRDRQHVAAPPGYREVLALACSRHVPVSAQE